MDDCWICGNIADSEEHKFKASDIKKYHGKKIDAFYISGTVTKLSSYKDKSLKFPKVICVNCNNVLTRPHDDAYDQFIDYCFKNNTNIVELPILNFEKIYGESWQTKKLDLFRYYAKHAGCKIVTSNVKANVSDLAKFIRGGTDVNDFVLRFEQKDGVRAIMNAFNLGGKYHHLYNSETIKWDYPFSIKFGGWLTNNYITANWIFGKDININSKNIFLSKYEIVLISDSDFFEIDKADEQNEDKFSKLKFIDQYMIGFENGYHKTFEDKAKYFESLIHVNNTFEIYERLIKIP